jgi:hypothetical protein
MLKEQVPKFSLSPPYTKNKLIIPIANNENGEARESYASKSKLN